MKTYFEVNFDGIPAPFHNYGGLAFGNIASSDHKGSISKPKDAALQALEKAKFVSDLGIKQALLPPQLRPDFVALKENCYAGSEEEIIERVSKDDPELLVKLYSAASMWTANAATVAPSCDTANGKLNIVTANLASNLHRSIEAPHTYEILNQIFDKVFPPLAEDYSDEGAANHMRFSNGLHIFVYGEGTEKFPARQNLQASQEVAELLQVKNSIFLKQNPAVIDKGVFHNDVIAVSNDDLLLYHEEAFIGADIVFSTLHDLQFIKINSADLSVEEAVKTYFFNSQIVTKPDDKVAVIAAQEVAANAKAKALMESHFDEVHYMDLRQSMNNGGGPACLRLRVTMNDDELATIKPNIFLSDELYEGIKNWINRNYREELHPNDLFSIELYNETKRALAELSEIMKLKIL